VAETTERWRLFVAVNPDERFVHRLATQLDAWRQQLRIAWARPQTWHVTLDFLGDWPPDRVPQLQDAVRRAVAAQRAFPVTPAEVGGFPSLDRARVLFLQLGSDGRLEALAGAVRAAVDGAWPDGPQDRKPFRPHLTFARIKRPLPASQRRLLRELRFAPWEPFHVRDVRLVRSRLHPAGARHDAVATIPLIPAD
jgi:2'-5' RNA ligase